MPSIIKFVLLMVHSMRFVEELSYETTSLLHRLHQNSRFHHVRRRAHCILLSSQGFSVKALMEIFGVKRLTIYRWLDDWDEFAFAGLYDCKGRGRQPKLTSSQKEQVKKWGKAFPKQLGKIIALVKEKFGILVSKRTIQRILKAHNFSWRRIRRRPEKKPDPQVYQQKEQELRAFEQQEQQGLIDLCYLDESGFSPNSYVPYAWQERGDTIELETAQMKKLSVLGFLIKSRHDFKAYTVEGTINSELLIACIDDFCNTLKKKTVLVIDNASTHTSKAFKAKIPEWKEKGLEIFNLPPYSPELNPIEIVWRFIKYEWIEFEAYKSWQKLVEYVDDVVINYGTKYIINFG